MFFRWADFVPFRNNLRTDTFFLGRYIIIICLLNLMMSVLIAKCFRMDTEQIIKDLPLASWTVCVLLYIRNSEIILVETRTKHVPMGKNGFQRKNIITSLKCDYITYAYYSWKLGKNLKKGVVCACLMHKSPKQW